MTTLRRLIGYLKPYLGRLLAASLLLALSGALMTAVIATVKPLVNRVLLGGAETERGAAAAAERGSDILEWVRTWFPLEYVSRWAADHAFVQVPLLMIAIFFVRGVVMYFGQYMTIKAGASVIRDLRRDLYRSVAFQSLSFFQDHSTGVILSRIVSDVQRLYRVTTVLLADLIRVGAQVPLLLFVALWHDWRMSLIALVMLPALGYPMVRLGKRFRRASISSQEHMGLVASRLSEAVGGVKVVQGFGMEGYEIDRFGQAVDGMLRADLRAGRAQSLSPSIMEFLGAVVGAAMFYGAGYYIARDRLDAGDFTVVLFCLGLLFMSIRRLNTVYTEMQNALAAGERVFGMMDRPRDIRERPGADVLPAFSSEIRFEEVRFGYGDETVLHGIDLTLKRGETVALVGPSGSGKSTIANLLPRFYDPTEGRVLFDGKDIRDATLASLRDQIGLVTQETVLFDDTVRNNLAYGRAETPLETVVEAARAAQAHGFISELPEGYDTMLGERGTRLSMGQRQRITIARALIKDPPILILDEATSALDSESEDLVQRALDRLMVGRTSLVIAHRLATIRNADRIVVLDQGRIVEQGSHPELLARGGAYARLYELQFKESPR